MHLDHRRSADQLFPKEITLVSRSCSHACIGMLLFHEAILAAFSKEKNHTGTTYKAIPDESYVCACFLPLSFFLPLLFDGLTSPLINKIIRPPLSSSN